MVHLWITTSVAAVATITITTQNKNDEERWGRKKLSDELAGTANAHMDELFLLFIYLKLTNKKKMNRIHAT